jgi:hypothetical protein
MNKKALLFLLLCASFSRLGVAEPPAACASSPNWSAWVQCRIDARTVEVAARDATIRNFSKQTSAPAISAASTSLVDQTSAPDLLGLAANIAKLSSHGSGDEVNSFNVSTSAYALYTAANRRDPLDPAVYVNGRDWRRVSFNVGRDIPDDSTTDLSSTTFGVKVLLLDHRDLSRKENLALINSNVLPALSRTAIDQVKMEDELQQALGLSDDDINNISSTVPRLADKDGIINRIIDAHLHPVLDERAVLRKVYEQIKQGTQWSFSFQTRNRDANGMDEYRAESLFDLGLHPRINLSINTGFVYNNSKQLGLDQRGGRFAEQFSFRITDDPANPKPIIISVSSEGKWLTGTTPTYQVQAKSALPLFDGVEIPISVTWANRTELIKEDHVKARFGFTFDISKLATRLK